MKNEENICQYCKRKRAITTLLFDEMKYSKIYLIYLFIYYLICIKIRTVFKFAQARAGRN